MLSTVVMFEAIGGRIAAFLVAPSLQVPPSFVW